MDSLDASRVQLALVKLYLGQTEARDKICRAIQYGAKFVSAGEAGVAREVDKTTSLARKVFRLLKSVNELEALITPASKATPLPVVLLAKSKSSLMGTYFLLDQIVWAGRTGIYKNKDRTELISKISLYCFLGGCCCNSLHEVSELLRLLVKIKHAEDDDAECERLQRLAQQKLIGFVKASLDTVVAIGLLQLAPKKVTPRVTGAFGFVTSLISCYQLLPSKSPKGKKA